MTQSSSPLGFFLNIQENGQERRLRLFATTSDWNKDIHISSDETSIELVGNQQLRFTTLDNQHYIYHSLLHKKVSYDVDLSHVKKNWNCAFYTCDFSGLSPPAYLDAQSWQSRIEMDYQEASRTAFHYTAHQSGDRGGHLIMGIGGSVMGNGNEKFQRLDHTPSSVESLYGPGQYIDTTQPFHVSVTHTSESVRLELSQHGKTIYNERKDPGYLAKCRLGDEIHTFIFSLWTGYMSWLDGGLPWYPEDGLDPVRATFSNIRIDDIQ